MIGPTRNHQEILKWALQHDAHPAEAKIYKFDSQPAILRFIFGTEETDAHELKRITWDDFFARFDLMGLSLAYDDSPDFEILQVEKGSPYRYTGPGSA